MTARELLDRVRARAIAARDRRAVALALLRVETWVSFPVFVIAWLVSAVLFAAVSGWRLAQLETARKRELLEKALGAVNDRTPK